MNELNKIIARATSRIAEPFFLLPIYGGNPVSRERVYCYELYHQMRCEWPNDTRYALNGEVDKRAHGAMQALGVGAITPDFLVHTPGFMEDNHAVIEVKVTGAKPKGIRKDLATLTLFRQGPGYERAIYLFYGEADRGKLIKRIRKLAATIEGSIGIELWHHGEVGAPAEQIAEL